MTRRHLTKTIVLPGGERERERDEGRVGEGQREWERRSFCVADRKAIRGHIARQYELS